MALGGSGHANTINSYFTRAACFADLRDHAVRLMKWCKRSGLRDVATAKAKITAMSLIISFLPCEPGKRRNLVSLTLVFASCSVRQRYFAGIANIGDVSFHAGLNAALARLGVFSAF
jgi:hypothetical protein